MIINSKHYRSVWFEDGKLKLINQPKLPHIFEIYEYSDYRDVATAIETMVVRGAPSIGATGAYGIALAQIQQENIVNAAQRLKQTRPTAQDLFYGIEKMMEEFSYGEDMLVTANQIADEYANACETIGEMGSGLIKSGHNILTHCNAGWLATVDWGTATSPIYKAKRHGKNPFVWIDETRPRMQGSRLTAYEMQQEEIPYKIIADNAAGHYMSQGEVDLVIVGADRIAINGDVANKIGTLEKAVLAKTFGIPFYVAAPIATIDKNCQSGKDIPIEERDQEEVTHIKGYDEISHRIRKVRISPEGGIAANPAFDVTPGEYITGIITEKGIYKPEEIEKAFN